MGVWAFHLLIAPGLRWPQNLTRMLLCSQAFCGSHRHALATVVFVGSLLALADGDERGRARARAARIRPFDMVPAREGLEKGADICPRARWTCPFSRPSRAGSSWARAALCKWAALHALRDAGTSVPRDRTTRPVLSGDAARKRTYAGRKIFFLKCML